jgi:hypothetical protein
MKVKILGLVTAACVLAAASSVHATIESYANQNVSSFGFYNDAGGGALGAPITQGVEVIVDLNTLSETSQATAILASGGVDATVSFGSLDTLQAYVGAGPAPAENTFTNVGVGVPFSRADTDGSGRAIVGIGGPFGTTAQVVSEGQLRENIQNTDAAIANSSVSTTAEFTALVLGALDFVVDFEASLEMFSALIPSPPGSSTSAAVSWSVRITDDTGGTVFAWTPNGAVDGTITGGTEISDSYNMTQTNTTSTNSSNTVSEALQGFRATGSLAPGTYTFSVEQSSRIDVQNAGIPEPGSCIVWGLLALSAGLFYRRKRMK